MPFGVTNRLPARLTTMWGGEALDAREVLDEAVARSVAHRTARVRQFVRVGRGAPRPEDLRQTTSRRSANGSRSCPGGPMRAVSARLTGAGGPHASAATAIRRRRSTAPLDAGVAMARGDRAPAWRRRPDWLAQVPCVVVIGDAGAIARMSYVAGRPNDGTRLEWATTEFVEYGVPVEIPDLMARAPAPA